MAAGESLHNQLQESMDSEQWDHALVVAYKMLETQPESSWLHTALGKIYYHLREFIYAETSLKTAIYHHENHAEAHAYLGLVYLKMTRIGTADDCCQKALDYDSSSLHAWTLCFRIKLAYKDIATAKECYATLERLGADEKLLNALRFDLIRHPANKEPIDVESEITARKNLIVAQPLNYIPHGQLAYLYNKFTKESDQAEMYVQLALKHHPTDPQIQETAMLIQRKKNIWLRILTAPAQSFTRPDQLDKNELAAVGLMLIAFLSIAAFGIREPWMMRFGVLGLIVVMFCSYTANLAFQYLLSTEIIHRHGKTSLFKEPSRNIHCLPFQKRALVIATLTLIAWVIFGLFLYLLTR